MQSVIQASLPFWKYNLAYSFVLKVPACQGYSLQNLWKALIGESHSEPLFLGKSHPLYLCYLIGKPQVTHGYLNLNKLKLKN